MRRASSSGTAASPAASAPQDGRVPGIVRAFLRVPLGAKLAGANALIVISVGTVALLMHDFDAHGHEMVIVMLAALAASLAVNYVLVRIALQPLRELEAVAGRLWRGDFDARVTPSPIADRDMARLGGTLNLLLDGLMADRARMRQLATQVIRAGEEEQARIARELHDSTAQTLAALTLLTSALSRNGDLPPALAEQIESIRTLALDALEEVRTLSHTIHPRVLDDLGLAAGLEALARTWRERDGATITVETFGDAALVARPVASVLYRVAQEALTNALRHGAPSAVGITLTVGDDAATLEVEDDGRGFQVDEARRRRPGVGLFSMQERIGLVNGTLDIASAPSKGTRVTAVVPLGAERRAPGFAAAPPPTR